MLSMLRPCPRAGKIKQSSANYKRLEETYQEASKEIEKLNQSLSDLQANRLSLDSLHEAEKSSSLCTTVWKTTGERPQGKKRT